MTSKKWRRSLEAVQVRRRWLVFDTIVAHGADASIAGEILHTYRPKATVVAASEQSLWELANDANDGGEIRA
jgi:hypothetical protein